MFSTTTKLSTTTRLSTLTRSRAAAAQVGAVAALLGVLQALPVQAQVPAYRFVDLGTINNLSTTATKINEAGQITGSSYNGTDLRAYRITPVRDSSGSLVWFQGTGGINSLMQQAATDSTHPYTQSWGINSKGELAGQALGTGYTLPQNAFFWNTALGGVKLSNTQSSARDINDAGSIAGDIFPAHGNSLQTIWRLVNGSFVATTIPRPAGLADGHARGLNNRDEVVGYLYPATGQNQPFLWLPSAAYGYPAGTTMLPTFGNGGYAYDLNDAGAVVGSVADSIGNSQAAALWLPQAGGGMAVTTLGGSDWSNGTALGLNNPSDGQPPQVVGNATNFLQQTRAVVSDSTLTGLRDLNLLTVNPPAVGLSEADAVNRGGLIVGACYLPMQNGSQSPRAFLLVPDATLPTDVSVPDAAPGGLSAPSVTASQVTLNWTDASSTENGFKVDRSTDGIAYNQLGVVPSDRTGTGALLAFSDPAGVQGMKYWYGISAYNTLGYNSAILTVITPGVPLAPSNCTVAALTTSSIRVRWTNNSNTETTVFLDRATNAGFTSGLQTQALTAANATKFGRVSFDATGLTAGTTYYFRVRAQNAAGTSGYSNTASAATPRK